VLCRELFRSKVMFDSLHGGAGASPKSLRLNIRSQNMGRNSQGSRIGALVHEEAGAAGMPRLAFVGVAGANLLQNVEF